MQADNQKYMHDLKIMMYWGKSFMCQTMTNKVDLTFKNLQFFGLKFALILLSPNVCRFLSPVLVVTQDVVLQ